MLKTTAKFCAYIVCTGICMSSATADSDSIWKDFSAEEWRDDIEQIGAPFVNQFNYYITHQDNPKYPEYDSESIDYIERAKKTNRPDELIMLYFAERAFWDMYNRVLQLLEEKSQATGFRIGFIRYKTENNGIVITYKLDTPCPHDAPCEHPEGFEDAYVSLESHEHDDDNFSYHLVGWIDDYDINAHRDFDVYFSSKVNTFYNEEEKNEEFAPSFKSRSSEIIFNISGTVYDYEKHRQENNKDVDIHNNPDKYTIHDAIFPREMGHFRGEYYRLHTSCQGDAQYGIECTSNLETKP